jgi:large subunit ribosomal protein L4
MPRIKKTEIKTKKIQVSKIPKKKVSALTVDVYDLTGKVVETMELPKEVFGKELKRELIAQAVRVYQANQRAGSASTKTRGDVRGSTRKIYRQKGTGRARHGGIRSPIFVHGGIAHGPHPRDLSLKLPPKMKKVALYSVLSDKAVRSEIKIITGIEKIEPKTKQVAALLKILQPKKNIKLLFVLDKKHDNVIRAVRNIQGLTYDFVSKLHTYEILTNDKIIFTKSAIEEMGKKL